jgi:hypothetical protein
MGDHEELLRDFDKQLIPSHLLLANSSGQFDSVFSHVRDRVVSGHGGNTPPSNAGMADLGRELAIPRRSFAISN